MLHRHRIRMTAAAASLALLVALTPHALRAQGTAAAAQARFVGSWEGALRVSGIALRLGFSFADSAGVLTGTLTSVDQGGVKLPVAVRVNGDSIRAEST